MKKLFIVATKIEGGKGGISSALTGYIDGLEEKGVEYKTITSHDKNILTSWLYAFMKVAYYSLKYRNQAVFWFHCGPWLSLIRKSSIALIPWLFGALTIGHIHSPTFYDYLSKSRTSQFLLKLSLLPFKHLIMLTPWWQNLLSRHNIIKPSSVSGNPNSLHFCEIAQSYISTPKPTLHKAGIINILSMAPLVQGKGIDTVIEALKLLPDNYHLTVAGDGQLEKELKELSVSLNVNSRVTFLGWRIERALIEGFRYILLTIKV